jgi:hypothetical protein
LIVSKEEKMNKITQTLILILLPCMLLGYSTPEPANPFEADAFRDDSLNVRLLGCWPTGPTQLIACDTLKEIAFLQSGGMIHIVDVSDPQNPLIIGELLKCKNPNLRFLVYDHSTEQLYIGIADSIQIWDVSDPLNGQQIGIIGIKATGLCVKTWHAYVTTNDSFFVVDISNPAQPITVGSCLVPGKAVAVSGSYAYVTGAEEMGFRVIDISEPGNPHQIACIWQYAEHICVVEPYAYLAGGSTLAIRIIDISDPLDPYFAGYFYSGSESGNIQLLNRIAYISSGGLRIVDVSDPENCFELGHFPCNAKGFVVYGGFSYIANYSTGLMIADVVPPSNPQQEGEIVLPYSAVDVAISGNYAFLAYGEHGLRIVDISDPAKPDEISHCDTPGNHCRSVFISGMYAYVLDGNALRIIDVSIPANPFEVGALVITGIPLDIHVSGSYAYVAAYYDGLRIIDISTPSAPFEVGYCDTTSVIIERVFVQGHYAYAAGRYMYGFDYKFLVFDISNPSNPIFIGYCLWDYCTQAYGLSVSGLYALVTTDYKPFVIDVSNPENPEVIACINTWYGNETSISGTYAYSVDGGYLYVIDFSVPPYPEVVGHYRVNSIGGGYGYPYKGQGIQSVENRAYSTHGDDGFYIFEFYGAGIEEEATAPPQHTSIQLLQNPISANHIELILEGGIQPIDLELYNLLGQKVKSYSLSPSQNSRQRLDIRGIPAGTYFLRMKQGNMDAVKVTILR